MELSDEVPAGVRDLLEDPGIFVPEQGITDEAMIVYQRMLEGQCMHCESALGEHACLIVNHLGVVMIFCGQPCLQDWHNMQWMMEQYDDFVSAAKFRNAASKGNHDG
jgi:hypothetical protein